MTDALKMSERKEELFSLACIGRISHLFTERTRGAIKTREKYLLGKATAEELTQASWECLWARSNAGSPLRFTGNIQERSTENSRAWAAEAISSTGYLVPDLAARAVACTHRVNVLAGYSEEKAHQRNLLRDIFGNPFRPVTLDPAWKTATVVALAEAIYADRAFDRLPILADALEEAGCTSGELLNHCRQPGEHVRGCWAVDLLLGRS